MNSIFNQIKLIRYDDMPTLRSKIRAFPSWFLWYFGTSKYGSRAAYYGSRAAVSLRPRWAGAHVLLVETLIALNRFDEAFSAWERAFLLNPKWRDIYRVYYDFLFHGQPRAAQVVMQGFLDVQYNFVKEHELDKLGIRFPSQYTTAIGHIALLDSYVKMGILGQRSTARPILLVSPVMPNACYLDYWRRYLPDMITDPLAIKLLSPLAKYLEDYVYAKTDSSGRQIWGGYSTNVYAPVQAQWEAEGRGPLLSLTDSDRERGRDCLRRLGVPSDAWFIGLHVREGRTPIQELRPSIHDARNADINTYRSAIKSITARGGWVIRMGDPSMKPLAPMHQVIDYAHSEVRSDWMDIFLWASCRFFIGVDSGPILVPPTFGVPCVITNWASPGWRPWFGNDLFIFKLPWSENEKRHLNFSEVLSSPAAFAEYAGYRESQRIKLVDNTPEEINDVVVEMMDRLDGKQNYTKEAEKLQERFDKLYIDNKSHARIGRNFLRKWEHLL